jgi:hypothetical protein
MSNVAAMRGDADIAEEAREAQVFDLDEHRRRRGLATEPWVKPTAAAAHFDCSVRTVYRWVQQGCPTKTLRGGRLRFQIGALKAWHESRS